MPETPFLLKYTRYINKELRAVNELKKELKVRQFNNEAEFKPKKKDNIFAKALSPFSKAKDVAEDVGSDIWSGLGTYGNQVQSVPAALFTKGKVQDGQYTTQRNLIGNPLANVASHVKAQRQLGLVDEGQAQGNILERLQEGFESANRAGKAYSEDPNIPSGVKFATGVAFDPSSYLAAGTVSKLPKVAKIGGAKGALARAPLQLIEGFDKPSTIAKFTVGGALGTQIADKVNVPGIGEGAEQFVGGMLGGGLAARPKGGFNQPQTKALTEVVTQEDRLHHGTFRTIPEGSIVTSIRGDIGPGFYTSLNDPAHAGSYIEGDLGANVTGFSPEYIAQAKKDISEHGGQQIYQFRPKRDLFLLHWEEGLDKVESSRINNVLQKRGVEVRVQTGMTGKQVFDVITENKYGKKDSSASYIDKGTPNVTGVLNDAGFDGMTNGYQYTIWRPNEVLESDLTPRKADYVTPKGVPAGTVVNKGQLTQTQIEKMDELLYDHEDFDPQEVVQYFKQHTDSYGDKLPGSPTIKEYVGQTDTPSQAMKNLADSFPVKWDYDEYQKMYESLTIGEKEKFHELADATPYMVSGKTTDDDWMEFLTKFHSAVKDTPSVKPASAIPEKSALHQGYINHLKKTGYIGGSPDGVTPMDFTDPSYDNYVYKQAMDALDWADSNGYLSEAGKKQFTDVLKKMDELEPTKGAQSLIDKGFEKSPSGILYKYEPVHGQLEIEGKTFGVNLPDEGGFRTYVDKDWVYADTIPQLVDKLDEQGFILEENLSPLGKALKDALMKDQEAAAVKQIMKANPGMGQAEAQKLLDQFPQKQSMIKTLAEAWDNGEEPFVEPKVANVGKAIQPKQGVMLSTKQLSTKSYLKQMYPHLPDNVVHKYVLQNYGLDGKHLGGEMTLLDYAKQEIGPAANPMGKYPGHIGYKEDITPISSEEIAGIKPKPKQSTWTVAGKQVDSKTILKYNNLSSKQKDLVHQISGLHPDDDLSLIIDQVVKNTGTDGTWKPYKEVTAKPAPKLVTPEEIMGLDQPTGPKTVDEFIEFTEKELGPQNKYGDAKDYAAPGQEGSPIAGAPKGKGSVTPFKQGGMWKASVSDSYNEEDLGDLIEKLTADGYKVLPPEGMIGGGAPGESLVSPREVHVGLTKSEKIGNALNKVKNVIIDHGIKNNEIATPIAKEYLRINQVMKVQATNLGKLAHRAEHMLGIKDITEVNLEGLTPAQNRVVERLRYMITSFDETLDQFDTEFKSIHEFWDDVRLEEGASKKKFSDVLTEYGNAIANKVSDAWLKTELKKLEGAISLSGEGGIPIPTSTVSRVSDVKLPKAVGEVINRAVDRVHPTRDSEWAQLYTTINNSFRSMWAAGDASFQFIQMLPTWADNPKRAFQATVTGLRSTKDPTFMADFIQRHDELRIGSNKPKVTEYLKHGGYIAESLGEGTDLGGLPGKIQKIPGYGKFLEKSNILFTETGNANRIALWDMLWDQYEAGGASMLTGLYTKSGKAVTNSSTRAQVLEAIANAGNRATGYSSKGFGGPYGSAIFFAPRFIQSQIEMVIKAAWGNGIESKVARRQLLKLIAVGTGITVAANEARGKDTEFDPRNSNFMRILDVGGADLSVFGPWDSLVKGVIRSVPHPDENGDFTLGDPTYLLRTKLAPVPSVLWDLTSGKDIIGNKTGLNSIDKISDLLLPFSIQDIGEEPIASTIFGLLGGKSTPLSDTEILNSRLKSAGVDPEDLVAKKEYLAQHSNLVPKADEGSYKRSQEITTDIKERRLANDNLTKSNGQSLVEFREKRKLLLTEQRNRLEEVIKEDTKKANTQQKKWLNSYMKIFEESKVKDYITNELNPEAFDIAVGKWANENGTEALDFINRYMGAGLNEVERAYYTDIRKLDAVGYFDLPKYQNMKSDLTEDQIDSLVANVDAIRAGNPKLQSEPWATTAHRLLKQSISSVEILDIIHSRQDSYANKDRTKLKEEFAKETLWFNSRANWDSYINYKPGKKMPKIGGALKANLKPVLK